MQSRARFRRGLLHSTRPSRIPLLRQTTEADQPSRADLRPRAGRTTHRRSEAKVAVLSSRRASGCATRSIGSSSQGSPVSCAAARLAIRTISALPSLAPLAAAMVHNAGASWSSPVPQAVVVRHPLTLALSEARAEAFAPAHYASSARPIRMRVFCRRRLPVGVRDRCAETVESGLPALRTISVRVPTARLQALHQGIIVLPAARARSSEIGSVRGRIGNALTSARPVMAPLSPARLASGSMPGLTSTLSSEAAWLRLVRSAIERDEVIRRSPRA